MSKTGAVLTSAALALSLFAISPTLGQTVDFGEDTSRWANDGQCDDPRFEGPGTAAVRVAADEMGDATDCRTAFEAGTVTLAGTGTATPPATEPSDPGIDFGDDSGSWANDGECDDPRFGGALENHRLADASDCRAAYEADPSIYSGDEDTETQTSASFNFGDDSGDYAGNGVCDDPRFEGPGSAEILLFADRLADATDCSALYHAGEITFAGVTGDPALAGANEIDFGDDTSEYANNERCDDPRFAGPGTDILLLQEDRGHDASDCQALFASGEVWLAGTNASDTSSTSEETADAPAPEVRINFGDDSGAAANDGICDDPRFQGRGAALELLDTNLLADASDCRAAYDAGTVTYQP